MWFVIARDVEQKSIARSMCVGPCLHLQYHQTKQNKNSRTEHRQGLSVINPKCSWALRNECFSFFSIDPGLMSFTKQLSAFNIAKHQNLYPVILAGFCCLLTVVHLIIYAFSVTLASVT